MREKKAAFEEPQKTHTREHTFTETQGLQLLQE